MTKQKFNNDVNALIAKLVLKSMKAYASTQAIDDQEETEPTTDDTIFADDEYADDLRDRYNQIREGK
jgi:hypothetical protein